jgi:uncharacterized protein (UPF0332 family)
LSNRSRRRTFERLTQPEYGRLRELTDEHTLDAASLEALVTDAVADRLRLARGMLDTARLLATHGDALVRRSAASRAYYGAYHAARATVFAVRRRDEDDHDELPDAVDSVVERQWPVGEQLRELKRLRHEADYSPYPGPNSTSEYTEDEFAARIQAAVDQAARLVETLDTYLRDRRVRS